MVNISEQARHNVTQIPFFYLFSFQCDLVLVTYGMRYFEKNILKLIFICLLNMVVNVRNEL
jgi:hypothetical protein